jgi:hypothetical protein
LVDVRVTSVAADPALANETVHVPDCPGVTGKGAQTKETGPAAAVMVVTADEDPSVAVNVTGCEPVHVPVLAANVAEVRLAATVTVGGMVSTEGALFDRVTIDPPAGAALDKVTVQEAVPLRPIVLSAHCKDDTSAGACRETVVEAEEPLSEAERVDV